MNNEDEITQDIPCCVNLSRRGNPLWESVPDGYSITYQPVGNGCAYLAWNNEIERSCRHFRELLKDGCFVARKYATYKEARDAVLAHDSGCTDAYFPNSEFGIIILPPMTL